MLGNPSKLHFPEQKYNNLAYHLHQLQNTQSQSVSTTRPFLPRLILSSKLPIPPKTFFCS